MVLDLDTICVSQLSPLAWAEAAAMPEAQAHFKAVANSFKDSPTAKSAAQTIFLSPRVLAGIEYNGN